jgi:hypothetical protein
MVLPGRNAGFFLFRPDLIHMICYCHLFTNFSFELHDNASYHIIGALLNGTNYQINPGSWSLPRHFGVPVNSGKAQSFQLLNSSTKL